MMRHLQPITKPHEAAVSVLHPVGLVVSRKPSKPSSQAAMAETWRGPALSRGGSRLVYIE